ncbi:MAG: 1-deoxy-D-xylulose-5-phosphate synthase [Oscillospiraceae bacterium]|nr:1-deoxy-D-xylulose-5-phosphate synthase [Oscillospiraceae bacterium]
MEALRKFLAEKPLSERTTEEKRALCAMLREYMIQNVCHSGGHLASNLGIVEATVAIHSVFDTEKDRLVFDVGHQCYVHKILTDRLEAFPTLRQFGGISGFPNPSESIHDAFIAGHASCSISAALGLSRARTAKGESHQVLALIGDGALTGGLAYEAINDLGDSGEHVIIILNDNGMSITRNVGGVSQHLARIRLKPSYFWLKKAYRKFLQMLPGGAALHRFSHKLKTVLKRGFIGPTLFEEVGITYLGPVDGHDLKKLTYLLTVAKEMEGPVLLHIITQKGRGYEPAELSPQDYHGVGCFDPSEGLTSTKPAACSSAFGNAITELAAKDDRICAITAAMRTGVSLDDFAKAYPDRFHDVGIAEGHAVSMAAGMAKGGLVPVVAVYSTFLQRAYDMLLHDVAIQKLHVVFFVDRCGLVGEDGATHHGIFDVAYLRQIPGMTILSATRPEEIPKLLHEAIYSCDGPVAIRAPRTPASETIPLRELTEQPEITIVSYGALAQEAYRARQRLLSDGIRADFYCLDRLKPLDPGSIPESVRKSGRILIAEEAPASGSIGTELAAILEESGVSAKTILCDLGDDFMPHGSISALRNAAGLDEAALYQKAREASQH